ncbi:MAG: hypothetical protein GY773_00880 [Actinomycetia bacterium]|nr:hypothetical protein [Actinomycetes bacterium]
MGRALSPLSQLIPRLQAESAREQALQFAADTATEDTARRLGESWRLFPHVSPDTHLAFALSEVDAEDPLWALHQAAADQMAAEEWGVSIPASPRQDEAHDALMARRQSRGAP